MTQTRKREGFRTTYSVYRTPTGYALSAFETWLPPSGIRIGVVAFRRYYYGDDAEQRAIKSRDREILQHRHPFDAECFRCDLGKDEAT